MANVKKDGPLEFHADPIKRLCFRRITLRIVVPLYAMTLLTSLLGSYWWMLPFASALVISGGCKHAALHTSISHS